MKTEHSQEGRLRVRTWSADSGCDPGVQEDLSINLSQENLNHWSAMLESFFRQELDKIREDIRGRINLTSKGLFVMKLFR